MGENKQIPSPQFDPNAKWDACLDLGIRRFVYSTLAGAVGGFLLFRYGSPVTRWALMALGAGVGIGSAYTECSYKFDEKLTTSKISDPASQGWTGLRLEFEVPSSFWSQIRILHTIRLGCANSLQLGFGRTDNNVGARKNKVTAKRRHGRLT
ncbi:unnamed protein product [Camellia sinensis]